MSSYRIPISDFSRYVEKVILMVSQALISPLAIFINLELLRISLWKKPRFLGAWGLSVKSQIPIYPDFIRSKVHFSDEAHPLEEQGLIYLPYPSVANLLGLLWLYKLHKIKVSHSSKNKNNYEHHAYQLCYLYHSKCTVHTKLSLGSGQTQDKTIN